MRLMVRGVYLTTPGLSIRSVKKMTERERLTKLLSAKISNETTVKIVTDYLLENGVIVPPAKIGDTTYQPKARSRKYNQRRKKGACNE